MGFRTSAKNFLKRALKRVIGEDFYEELRESARGGYAEGLGEAEPEAEVDRVREGRITGDVQSKEDTWYEVSPSTYRWVRPSKSTPALKAGQSIAGAKANASVPLPVDEQPRTAPKAPETDSVEENKRPLLCEKLLVKDHLLIDYVDKSGNATRRPIRVEEVYAYDDGVLVLRAWCRLRKAYRTFVSTRIQECRSMSDKEKVLDLLKRLKTLSVIDPGNVAQEILNEMSLEIAIAIYSLTNYRNRGITKRYVTGKKKNALVDWVLQQSKAESLLVPLDADTRSAVEDIVREWIGDYRISQSTYDNCAKQMRRQVNHALDRYEVRRQDLILFVGKTLEGEAAKGTAVTRLEEDLLDPLKRDGNEVDMDLFLTEFEQLKKDSKKAERSYKSKRKPEFISKQYRRFERGEPVHLLAIEVAQRNLQKCLDDERLLFGKDEFEECVMKEVSFVFSEKELEQEGEMFRKRCGSGLSAAYCSFGLQKENRSWFTDSTGKSWLDLKTRTQAG